MPRQKSKSLNPLHQEWVKALRKSERAFLDELEEAAKTPLAPKNASMKGQDGGFPVALQPVAASTWRQMREAAEILKRFQTGRRGILLADDVGLGKTFVAGIVAAIYAGTGHRVRVLSPNALVKEKWLRDLATIIEAMQNWQGQALSHFHNSPVKRVGQMQRLFEGQIGVSTASKSRMRSLNCDLLILDEAHRGSLGASENSPLERVSGSLDEGAKVLLLTATPFSIKPESLLRMLELCGSPREATDRLSDFWNQMRELHQPIEDVGGERQFAATLAVAAEGAVTALEPYVLRHSAENLRAHASTKKGSIYAGTELKRLGRVDRSWKIEIPVATETDLELLIRMDRAQRLASNWSTRGKRSKARIDPRYHTGWSEFDRNVKALRERSKKVRGRRPEELEAVRRHLVAIERLQKRRSEEHPKVSAVADELADLARSRKKVLVFCYHYATVVELALATSRRLFPRQDYVRAVVPRKNAPDNQDLWLATQGQIREACKAFNSNRTTPCILIATNRLSEGVDLHEDCTRLIHFELSPSPLRMIQREGRLRRILGSGDPRTPRAIRVATPVFKGTRDERLADIVQNRMQMFDLLLGGVEKLGVDAELRDGETRRRKIFDMAKGRLQKLRLSAN